MRYKVLYRGPLSSCNYSCEYCPFAQTKASKESLEEDRSALNKLTKWLDSQDNQFKIFFTPKGEALTYPYYKEAITKLSWKKNIGKVVIQTNLSCDTDWIESCNVNKTAFWLTYHPEEVKADDFAEKCLKLNKTGVQYSVGVVGTKEYFDSIRKMRNLLPDETYLWINAFKRSDDYYTGEEIEELVSIDPLFRDNLEYYDSLGQSCKTGYDVFAVEGNGDIKRCHFSEEVLGNISSHTLDQVSKKRPCSTPTCHCHIGYVYLEHLKLDKIYGSKILERIPNHFRNENINEGKTIKHTGKYIKGISFLPFKSL
ncbi:MAG: radical SAM protein [Deltaproteobacteria bacterium]|nr:radical SAM protein [Deltaproteobacteria bacterium]